MRARTWPTVTALLVLAGCLPIVEITSRTRILEDGTAIRETRLVKVRRKADDEAQKLWNERPLIEDLGRGFGRGFPSIQRTDDEIKLYGVFTDPESMPPDFLRDVPLVGAQARNRIEFRTEDVLLGTRYLYRERFIDAIAPRRAEDARDELVAFCVGYVRSALRYEFERDFDLSRLDLYLEEELTPITLRILDAYWKERRHLTRRDPLTGRTGIDRVADASIAALGDLGLELDPEGGDDANVGALRRWLGGLLAAKLDRKRSGGRPLQPRDFAYLMPEDSPLDAIKLLGDRVAEREFGSVDAAAEAFQRALLGVVGTFGSPPAEAEFRFDCGVEMPGLLLRTNGFLDGNSAFFLFDGQEIYPRGVQLELESVVPKRDVVGSIRELDPDLRPRDWVSLIHALEDLKPTERQAMSDALRTAATHGTIGVLPTEGDGAEAKRNRKLLELLEDFLR